MRNVTDVSRTKFKMRFKRGDEEKTPFRAGASKNLGEIGASIEAERLHGTEGENYRRGKMR